MKIVFLGDSVTEGCFDLYAKNGSFDTYREPENVYHTQLLPMLEEKYGKGSIEIVNSGISGDNSAGGCKRLDTDVIAHHPDLTVVCYGLNDAGQGAASLDRYGESLREIFTRVTASGAECIFMTPNLRSDDTEYVNPDPLLERCVRGIAANECEGWLQTYLARAREVAAACHVPVCDCNALWLAMKAGGVNTNALLSNDVNHPTKELHWMFAYELVKMMFA